MTYKECISIISQNILWQLLCSILKKKKKPVRYISKMNIVFPVLHTRKLKPKSICKLIIASKSLT